MRFSQRSEAVEFAAGVARESIVRGPDLPPEIRQLLISEGMLHQIIKGWYWLEADKDAAVDSSPFKKKLWAFLRFYLVGEGDHRLGPELSLALQFASSSPPSDATVIRTSGGNNRMLCRFGGVGISILFRQARLPADVEIIDGLRVLPAGYAMATISPKFYRAARPQSELVLRTLEADDLAGGILSARNTAGAQRVLGGLDALGLFEKADQVRFLMRSIRAARAIDPYGSRTNAELSSARIEFLWRRMRTVIENRMPPPTWVLDSVRWLERARNLRDFDASHSLQLEDYDVSQPNVARIIDGQLPTDVDDTTVLQVRKYLTIHTAVLRSIEQTGAGAPIHDVLMAGLASWHVESDFRTDAEAIRRPPLPRHPLSTGMKTIGKLVAEEPSGAVRAILAHFFLVDLDRKQSGILARFTMNFLFADAGYPWTIIRAAQLYRYRNALEEASFRHNINPLIDLLAHEQTVRWEQDQ